MTAFLGAEESAWFMITLMTPINIRYMYDTAECMYTCMYLNTSTVSVKNLTKLQKHECLSINDNSCILFALH